MRGLIAAFLFAVAASGLACAPGTLVRDMTDTAIDVGHAAARGSDSDETARILRERSADAATRQAREGADQAAEEVEKKTSR